MESLEDKIPAFVTWKMFLETIIPTLTHPDSAENTLLKLSKLVKKKEFLNVFVYAQNSDVLYEEYTEISQYYKAFTVWLLGRFYYLFHNESLERLYSVAADVQWYILHKLSLTQPQIYEDITMEYLSALKQLIECYKDLLNSKTLKRLPRTLKLFSFCDQVNFNNRLNLTALILNVTSKKSCLNLIKQTIQLLQKIVMLNITLSRFNMLVEESFNCFLGILKRGPFTLKLSVLAVYAKLIKSFQFYFSEMPADCIKNVHQVISCVDSMVKRIYIRKVKINVNDLKRLEKILILLLSNSENLEKSDFFIRSIASFLITKETCKDLHYICLEKISSAQLTQLLKNPQVINKHLENMIDLGDYRFIDTLRKQILNEICSFITSKSIKETLNLIQTKASLSWLFIYNKFKNIDLFKCGTDCCHIMNSLTFLNNMLDMIIYIKIEIQNYCITKNIDFLQYLFFEELSILGFTLRLINFHMDSCSSQNFGYSLSELVMKIFSKLPISYSVTSLSFVYNCIAYPFSKSEKGITGSPLSLNKDFQDLSKTFWFYLIRLQLTEDMAAIYLHLLAQYISLGFIKVNIKTKDFENLQNIYIRAVKKKIHKEEIFTELLKFPTCFNNRDEWIQETLLPGLLNKNFAVQTKSAVLNEMKIMICASSSQYVQTVIMQKKNNSLSFESHCLECLKDFDDFQKTPNLFENILVRIPKSLDTIQTIFKLQQPLIGKLSVLDSIVFDILELYESSHLDMRKEISKSVYSFSHLHSFHTTNLMQFWIRLLRDEDQYIQRKIANKIHFVLKRQSVLPEAENKKLWKILFAQLKINVKRSLETANDFLQESLLLVLENITAMKLEHTVPDIVNLLFYFIILGMSAFPIKATAIFIEVARVNNTTTGSLYYQYKTEFCVTVTKLCVINQILNKTSMVISLDRLTLSLGYYTSKTFISQESRHLVPILISLFMKTPQIEKVIEEIANVVDTDVSGLLTSKYGNIFLYMFLNESEQMFEKCVTYIEKRTQLHRKVLSRQNFQTILHELLLNFHNKRDRVLSAMKILAQDVSNSQFFTIDQIPDFLQPKFLGILAYFDMKLIGRYSSVADQVLLSLADLLVYMGPKHITPLRFKIIAMLTTCLNLTYDKFPELNCDVWIAFIKTCEIEALGSQLASIFVSLAPLAQHYPDKIYQIFKYLVIENEMKVKDNIQDLFFIVESDINYEICIMVKKYLKQVEDMPFKGQLKTFMKYLSHETIDIRIHGFKYIKKLLEKNREELHELILGFNGIDPLILEFLDILMFTCRERDVLLKLACGECIGELGAIEPTYLPQKRKDGEENLFIFFITEDAFIVKALNELTRALHSEKNTQNMDRFALAIQEILKLHGISPDLTSPKHNIWSNFSESHRELMLPLLSSRYTMVYSVEDITVSPIYGSTYGLTFKSWIYNWTTKLVLTVTGDKKKLLEVCLPSLKQDYRTLMQFLPHILLHALLEGNESDNVLIYTEIMTIINCIYVKSEPQTTMEEGYDDALQHRVLIRDGTKENQCGKVIFVLLDFLDRWVREWKWKYSETLNENNEYKRIEDFLTKFSKLKLAHCNFLVGEYPRALMHLEEHLKNKTYDLNNQFSFLVKLYAQLNDADGVAGVTALQSSDPPLEQRLLSYLLSGKLADAAACYEQIPTRLKPVYIQGLVRCYLDMENINTALYFTEGVMDKQPHLRHILLQSQAEPLWRLCRFDELDNLLQQPELARNKSWDINIGQALVHLRKEEREEFKSVLDLLRLSQVDSLGSASLQERIYNHGYSSVAKLHIINELQHVEEMIHELLIRPNDQNVCESVIKKLVSEWDFRLKVVQESVRIQEPILCLRRVAIDQAKDMLKERVPHALSFLNKLLGESWLLSASIARVAGMEQQAYTFTLKAEEYSPPCLFLEKAKLQWLREEHEQALSTLKRGIESLMPENASTHLTMSNSAIMNNIDRFGKKLAAKAKLLIASYNDALSNVDTETNIQHYKEAVEVNREWERSLVCLAQYYDRIFQTLPENEKDTKGSDIQVHMLNYFGKSLQYGTKYIYQSMPRFLSIWFDCGTRLLEISPRDDKNNTLLKLTKMVDMYLNRLPVYVFFTAFSQLVSRICHPQKQVYMELKSIIIKLILKYPQQSLWNIMSVIKSSYTIRNKRCAEILNDSLLKTSTMNKLVTNFTLLAEKLIELCNKEIADNVQNTTVNALLRSLPRLLKKDDFSQIMVPIEKFRKLVLPNSDLQNNDHNPFPNHSVYIAGIENEVVILNSLQRPRKITFRGSDGKRYVQMLKPKDDLRKDFRLMEFNDIVNQMLKREPDSRQRRLYIRLYSVVPLNEECGLIEWIPNLVGLRPILLNLYKQIGAGMRGRDLKQFCCHIRDPLAKKRDVFLNSLLPKHPPVLHDWFRKTFPDAQSWLIARDSYVRTTAVMSMIGYILGLGDRHGENILFDSTTGDTVHVDFNCLFNKGETFEWPERVPFRLTHNMVSALGPLGVEGMFRKSCACTLKVLRAHSATLMSIITPFVYDPLVSWPRNISSAHQAQTSERTNEQAVEHVRNIDQRLQGIVKTKGKMSIPLSVEGQSNHIIQEAISIDNLCQMYIGWGPYL